MAERLNNIAYSNDQRQFNPRLVSLDIRTPDELVDFSNFLVTLGRDVSTGRHAHPPLSHKFLSLLFRFLL